MARIGGRDIAGVEVEIHAYGNGRWEIQRNGETLGTGDTLDKATAGARTRLAKSRVKVNVPFITRKGEKAYAYSLHAKSHKPMVDIGGDKEEWDMFGHPFQADMPASEVERYLALVAKTNEIQKQIRLIETEWTLDLGRAVREAIDAAAARAVQQQEVGA